MSRFNQDDEVDLGNGVYAKFKGYNVVLTTKNNDGFPVDIIVLDPEALDNLNQWLQKRFREDYQKAK